MFWIIFSGFAMTLFIKRYGPDVTYWSSVKRQVFTDLSNVYSTYCQWMSTQNNNQNGITQVLLIRNHFLENDHESNIMNITNVFLKGDDELNQLLENKNNEFRLEIRYLYNGTKFRAVFDDFNNIKWPLYPEEFDNVGPRKRIISATSIFKPPNSDETIECDITQRVLKYMGPYFDFHTCAGKMKWRWIFPYTEFYTMKLKIIDIYGKTHLIDLEENPNIEWDHNFSI